MPTISMFFGIYIRMYHRDHMPPHFHAIYGGDRCAISIETLELLDGTFPRRALSLVIEWAMIHRSELRADWELAVARKPLIDISPLE